MCAARNGTMALVQALLAAGADVNAETHRGHSTLWIALRRGKPRAAQLLRQAGAAEPATREKA